MCLSLLCKVIAFVLAGLGLAAIIIGAVLGFAVLPNNIESEIELSVRLAANTRQFDRWKELPFKQQIKINFFTVTNPGEVSNGATPIVNEIGPYVYDQTRRKDVLNINENEATISYNEHYQFDFNSSASSTDEVRSEDDNILMLNTPLMMMLHIIEHTSPQMPDVNAEIPVAFPNIQNLFQSFSVRNFLFEGINFCPNPLQAPNLCQRDITNVHYLNTINQGFSFAFLRRRSVEVDGPYLINSGLNNIENLGSIIEWNESPTLPDRVWGTTGNCRNIRGVDGTIFPPHIRENDRFDVFHSDICRVITLEHDRNEDFEDIPSQRREFEETTLDNTGPNECFCTRQTMTPQAQRECWPSGFLDLASCTGAHFLLSKPHFLNATEFRDTVEGLNPNSDIHESYTIMEPGTGTPLKIVRRFQYNIVLRPTPGVTITNNLGRAVLPLLWIEESMELPQHLIDKIHDEYLYQLQVVSIVTWVLIGGGIAIFLVSLVLRLVCCC